MDRDCLSAFRCVSSVLTRRTFLRGSALTALALASGMTPRGAAGCGPCPLPFPLGRAFRGPPPRSVVPWTRLAVDTLDGGGMPPIPIVVEGKIATDPNLRHVVQHGTLLALPEDGHSVHVAVNGLVADRWYWYQFESGGNVSPLGRT